MTSPTRTRAQDAAIEALHGSAMTGRAKVVPAVVPPVRAARGTRNGMSYHPGPCEQAVVGARSEADRAAVEHALRASEQRYRRLFESAKDGILILDAECGQVLDVNPYLVQLLGYPRADFLGKYIWDFGPFKDIVASKEAFEFLRANDYLAYENLPLETSDGRIIDVGFVSNVYLVDDERFIQCNIRDITARKLAERTRADLEAQLRATQKMEAIGGLTGGIAHDFNNLLSVILCYSASVLEALPAGSALRDDLHEIEKAGNRAAALTHQLLAFSRKQVLEPVALDVNQVAGSIEKMLRRILGEDIELVFGLDPELGFTIADRSQIEQVIMNLVVNARDAMPDGGRLTIETRNVELDADYAARHVAVAPGSYVELAVTDSGAGMDPKTRARVFEPYFTTKAVGKGTGLGLSTVYGIVKQTGGNIWIYSEPEHGTTFKIYLPRSIAMAVAEPRPPGVVTPSAASGSETILLVEDEEIVRILTHRILTTAGYLVLTAVDGFDALTVSEAHTGRLDLLLTDVVMPRMGGRTLASHLRRIRPDAKILFMSGYSDDAVFHNGILEPGSQFIGKPFNAAALTRKIRDMLDEATSTAIAAGSP